MSEAPLRALVVDDNRGNRQILSAILRSQNVEVEVAENGAIAVETASQTCFDLILMDLNMPLMDGHVATALIRRHEAAQGGRRARIVIVSSQDARGDVARARAAGADLHIAKPCHLSALVNLIGDCRRAAKVEAFHRGLHARLAGARHRS